MAVVIFLTQERSISRWREALGMGSCLKFGGDRRKTERSASWLNFTVFLLLVEQYRLQNAGSILFLGSRGAKSSKNGIVEGKIFGAVLDNYLR
jgi:hypothetical protein